jgi:hypothetical protein
MAGGRERGGGGSTCTAGLLLSIHSVALDKFSATFRRSDALTAVSPIATLRKRGRTSARSAVAQVPARMWRGWVLAQMWARTRPRISASRNVHETV